MPATSARGISALPKVRRLVVGRSVEGRALGVVLIRPPDPMRAVLLLAGFHGDEPKGVALVRRLADELGDGRAWHRRLQWVIVPEVNPDGLARRTRRSARKVDLNRNFPTENWAHGSCRSRMYGGPSPASEPETRAIIRLIERYAPSTIVTVHSINRGRFCNNYDGPAGRVAQAMARRNGYPVSASIGYPTPGSFGTWSGQERGIATVTLELPTEASFRACWTANRAAILASV